MSPLSVPPLVDLLDGDPVFMTYMQRRPKLPVSAQHGEPWRVLARRPPSSDKPVWASKQYPSYAVAYDKVCDLLDTERYEDIVLISKRRYMAPPVNFVWDTVNLTWCSRCRRPTRYERIGWHPGIHTSRMPQGITPAHVQRCVLCGVPDGFAPTSAPRFPPAVKP